LIATVEAAGLVDPHFAGAFQFELGNAVFGVSLHFRRAERVATAFARLALIAAEKYMVFEMTHRALLWGGQL
jgi:hypothetical protein